MNNISNYLTSVIIAYLISAILSVASAENLPATDDNTDSVKDNNESQSIIEQAVPPPEKSSTAAAKAWIPSAVKYDWIQLTSNEWLKGEIKGMYKKSLEFDSDKLDLLTIKWEDVKILRSHKVNNINIEGVGAISGILEVTDDRMEVVSDYENETYDRADLISFAPGGQRESDLWAVKLVFGLDIRDGNTNQIEYTARFDVKRRASATRFLMYYIGNLSKTNGGDDGSTLSSGGSLVTTINNHRLTANFDYYKTRYFFYTPVFAELFSDPFLNIELKTTLGAGAGYTFIDDGKTELSVSGGPAYVKTRFSSVQAGQSDSESTPAAVLKTAYNVEITDDIDFDAKYNIQVGNQASGGYTHHIILSLESEITGSLDFDTSFIWDRVSNPTEDSNGITPVPNDFRITFGVSYTY